MTNLKVTVIGAGSSYTPELIDGIIKRYKSLPIKELYLYDIDKGLEKLTVIAALSKRMLERAGLDIKVIATLDRIEAIKNADFILTQIRVGGLAAREKDELIPLEHGAIGQETTGAGGFAKAIRTIPVILDICKDIEKYSKDAWLINFTNPAGMVTEAIYKYSNVRAIGLCNVPIGMKNNIARLLEVNSDRISLDFVGLNHLVWGVNAFLDEEKITDNVLELMADGSSVNMANIPDMKWDSTFLKALGYIPCPYHRYYYMKLEMLEEELKNKATSRARQVMQIEKELFEIYKDEKLLEKPEALEKRGGAYYSDAAISLIDAIYNDKEEIHTVNVQNGDSIFGLPRDVVIETNCVIGRAGAIPVRFGELPPEINGLLQVVKAYEQKTIQAAVSGNYYDALNALYLHPLIDSAEQAKKILDDILNAHSEYLPLFYKKEVGL